MSDEYQTKITIKEDKATGMASSMAGANLDGVAFNLVYISNINIHLAQKIFKLYEQARRLENEAP